jgi:hypothetical protein
MEDLQTYLKELVNESIIQNDVKDEILFLVKKLIKDIKVLSSFRILWYK